MSLEGPSFMHWKGSPDIAPFLDYLVELGALRFSGTRPHSLEMHYNEGIEICHIMKGTHTWQVEGQTYRLYPGEGFITCPWQRHGNPEGIHERGFLAWLILKPRVFERDGTLELGDWSRLDADTRQRIGRLFAGNTRPVIPPGVGIMELFREIDAELVRKDIGYRERINLLLDTLLIKVARSLSGRRDGDNRDDAFVRKLQAVLRRAFHDRLSVDDLAYRFGMSASSFTRKVKTLTGFSPGDYLLELKIGRAKSLLAETEDKIVAIASECGFCSSQYFSRVFFRRTRMTPSAYRERHRSGSQATP